MNLLRVEIVRGGWAVNMVCRFSFDSNKIKSIKEKIVGWHDAINTDLI